jgi:hypothetical protein
MPEIGEIRYGREIGRPKQTGKYIYHACLGCGKERWVKLNKGEPASLYCRLCIRQSRSQREIEKCQRKGTVDNPVVGDIRSGKEVGKRPGYYRWSKCPVCGNERWQKARTSTPDTKCRNCGAIRDRTLPENATMVSPVTGEIKLGWEVGKGGTAKYYLSSCTDCGAQRWVMLTRHYTPLGYCSKCVHRHIKHGHPLPLEEIEKRRKAWTGKGNPRYKRMPFMSEGYRYVPIEPGDFFFSMADKRKFVQEHRLVMAKHLSRCLLPWEIVHHKNGIRDDNRIENLKLLKCPQDHLPSQAMQGYIKKLEKENQKLKAKLSLIAP